MVLETQGMYQSESIHKYPRFLTTLIEGLCVLLVVLTSARIGFFFLRVLWGIYGLNDHLTSQIPLLPTIIAWINSGTSGHSLAISVLWPTLFIPLAWSALALFITIMLRNAFPAVRTSPQGMLVEFAGSWLPVPWEHILALKVTEDPSAERFVLIVQTDDQHLTAWHRIYSFFYGLSWKPGFYITSRISDFDQIIQTMLSESERTARASETARPIRLQEDAQSPLFRLLLSPGSFFSRSAATNKVAADDSLPSFIPGGPILAEYPSRITILIGAGSLVLAVLTVLRYLAYWSSFLALEVPALRTLAPFSWSFSDPRYVEIGNAYPTQAAPFLGFPGRPDLPAPWWIMVAAHLTLILAIIAISWLRNLLPAIESRNEGIAVRDARRGRWLVLPWIKLRALKLTEISEQSQILLLQGRGLPASQGLTSLLYDGSLEPGVLITSAISNFQPMLQDALGHITALEGGSRQPVLRQEARSPLLWMALGGRAAREALVAEVRADADTHKLHPAALLPAARAMSIVALPPALLIALAGLTTDRVPSLGLLAGVIALWIFGMLEWPLIGLISVLLDDNTGGGEEGYRALYLYPRSQFPRLLPLVAAIIFQIVGITLLPTLAWIGAIIWAFWLGRGLWESLYEWRGSQAVLGGLLPTFWQLLLLIGFLLVTR
jgi:hypothetical protein